jgi:hypothetical protein
MQVQLAYKISGGLHQKGRNGDNRLLCPSTLGTGQTRMQDVVHDMYFAPKECLGCYIVKQSVAPLVSASPAAAVGRMILSQEFLPFPHDGHFLRDLVPVHDQFRSNHSEQKWGTISICFTIQSILVRRQKQIPELCKKIDHTIFEFILSLRKPSQCFPAFTVLRPCQMTRKSKIKGLETKEKIIHITVWIRLANLTFPKKRKKGNPYCSMDLCWKHVIGVRRKK